MKIKITLKALLLCSSLFLKSNDELTLKKAENYFLEKKWASAYKNYDLLKYKNGTALKNMGICCFNLKKYPQALIKFKQAFNKGKLQHFFSLVELEKQTYEKLGKEAPSFVHYFFKKLFLCMPFIFIQIIFLMLLLMLLYFFIRHWRISNFTKKEASFLKKIGFWIMFCGLIWYLKLLYFDKYQAIVIKPQVAVYAGPEKTFHIIQKLDVADEIVISGEKNSMYQIQHLKTVGWIDCDTVELINNYE